MPQPAHLEQIQAHIEGEISGQIAVGNHNLQIGSVHGGVVNIALPEQQPRPQPRPTPVQLRPRPFPGLLDRETEIDAAATTLQSATPIEFHGQAGLGKTALLRCLAHHSAADSFPDGIVYLSVRRQPLEDLVQSLFDAFYESPVPFKPTDSQIRRALQSIQAIIILDDVELARDEVETLMDVAPMCAFLLASSERRLWGEGQALELRGLPPEEALALIERELGRSVTSDEQITAQALCTALNGHPLHILQAAAMMREENLSLAEVARRVQTPSPVQSLTSQVLNTLPEQERQVLAALATLGNAPIHTERLADVMELPNVAPILETLQQRGLVQAHSPRYSLTGALDQTLQQAQDLTPWAERALLHFVAWTEEHRQSSERLLKEADAILQILEWAVGNNRWAEAIRLGQAVEGALILGRRWAAWDRVLQWMLQAAQTLQDRAAQAWAMHQIGTRALCLEDSTTARTSLTKALRLREGLGDQTGAAITRHNLNILMDPPAPPKKPPQAPSTPAPGISPLSIGIVALATVALLALGGLGVRNLWSTPTATATLTAVPTRTPAPTATTTSTSAPTPSHTPTATTKPTTTTKPTATATPSPTPTATSSPTPTPVTPTSTPVTPSPTPTIPSDTTGPTISDITKSNERIVWPQGCGEDQITIRASIIDPSGISAAKLTYRVLEGQRQGEWVALPMNQVTEATYEATVDSEALEASLDPPSYGAPATMEYYIQGFDEKGNRSESNTNKLPIEYCLY